jgi:hypothetical protein
MVPTVSHRQTAVLGAAVGLDVRCRAYPGGDPTRDAAQVAVLERLRGRLAATVRLETEVPLDLPGDLRAWDGRLTGLRGLRTTLPTEAETNVADWQALERRLALKLRDAGEPHVLLVLADTRHNRAAIATVLPDVATRFPIPARRALAALARGEHPGGSAIVFL